MKLNIINPGKECKEKSYNTENIAKANIFVLEQSFTVAMKGANYLSGGQTLEDATARLSAINRVKKETSKGPCNLSFSWSQAIQLPLLDLCKGSDGHLKLEEMAKLYQEQLEIAAARGEYKWKKGEGDHKVIKCKRKRAQIISVNKWC